MKKIMIFGSTGSIGKSVLSCLRKEKKYKVLGLCANRDVSTIYSQIKEFSPAYVCMRDEAAADKLKKVLGRGVKLLKGQRGLEDFSRITSDISFMAISGVSALLPLMINMRHAKRIALANKESIVLAGSFILKQAKRLNTEIIPVDSEINALFQLFKIGRNDFGKVYLTASGGSLFNHKKADLRKVTVKKVLSHPTWRMGKRITVDCATLLNKGFEVIEAHRFFGLPLNLIDIVVHKESIIHALIECKDGHLFACVYPPDMKTPISFALNYPKRGISRRSTIFKNDLSFNFTPLKIKDFPLLKMILEAAKRDDNSLVILNACDEVAIDYFLKKKIKFCEIYKAMGYIFSHYPHKKINKIDDIFFWDKWARENTRKYLDSFCFAKT